MDCRGEFAVDNETYSVEPVDETLTGHHRVYRESDSTQPTHVCGMFDNTRVTATMYTLQCELCFKPE